MAAQLQSNTAAQLAESVDTARRRYRKRLARCQKKFSGHAVHALRVETRRVLALLDLLKAFGLAAPSERLAKSFKKRLDVFDDLRDTQVQLQLLEPVWNSFPEAHGLKACLKRRECRLVAKLAGKIQSTKYSRQNRRLKDLGKEVGGSRRVSARAATAALRSMFRRLAVLRRRVRSSDPATIHCLRVAFKRYRYVSELLQPLHPEFTVERLERMKAYQTAAGEIQDLEVLLARLQQVVKDRKVSPAALRRLRTELQRRKREAIHSFMAAIDELSEFSVR